MNCGNSNCIDKIVKDYISKAIEESNSRMVPVGTVISYMATEAPVGFLEMDGKEHNIDNYPALAEHFRKKLGSINFYGGDGIITFAVPDARGEFIRGYDFGKVRDPEGNSRGLGKHQDATKHVSMTVHGNTNLDLPEADTEPQQFDNKKMGGNTYQVIYTKEYTASINTVKQYTSRPTNITVLYCIKF